MGGFIEVLLSSRDRQCASWTSRAPRARKHENLLSPTTHPRVLLCWGYHRRGWVAPFEQLGDSFDFQYLFHLSKEEEEGVCTDQPRHYWDEFRDAHEILERIRPDRIVFMSLTGLRTIALNMAARRHGVPTFILQHGYFRSLENYLWAPRPAKAVATPTPASSGSARRATSFMLRSNLARESLDTARSIAMVLSASRTSLHQSQLKFRFAGRIPDWYITYSDYTGEVHRQLDGAEGARIVPVGIPEFDPIFRRLAEPKAGPQREVLLIDSPNAENRWGVVWTTVKRKARFLEDLSRRLQERGYGLTVKLHPETYDADWLPDHPNTRYVRDHEMGSLIERSTACVGFDSTLVIPAIIARPTMLFELSGSTLTAEAQELGVAIVATGLECTDEQLSNLLDRPERSPDQIRRFALRFAHATDGLATERLGDALRGSGAISPRS